MSTVVLHVLDHTLPSRSGYTTRTGHIIAAQQQLGYDVHLISSPRQAAEHQVDTTINNIPVWRTHAPAATGAMRFWHDAKALKHQVRHVVHKIRPHIVHVHSPVLNFWPTWWACNNTLSAVVYEIRAFWEDAAVANGKTTEQSLRYKLTRYAETLACQRAAHVFALCEGLRADLLARGLPAHKVSLSPNVVPPHDDTILPPPQYLQQQLQGKTVLTFIGSLYHYEGVDVLLQAFSVLAATDANLYLLIVGQGPEYAALTTLHASLPHNNRIIFTGSLPANEAKACYTLSSAIILPRRDTRLTQTVTPMKIPEAQQHGVVVIAADVGGHREMVQHNKTGYLVNAQTPHTLAADIAQVLQQQQHWPTIIAQAKAAVQQQRGYNVLAQAYSSVYQRLCIKP
jgi:PEP-CTERM/exosortase A-associated glycosyltransferase